MKKTTTQYAGPHERHCLRKADNPLFADSGTPLSDLALATARNRDHELRLAYENELVELLQQTVALKSNEESDVILKLKESLDRLYETAAAVSEDREQQQQAISQLVNVIMSAIRRGAGNDSQALQELEQEELAREAHFVLLDSPLVADLLNPDSPIQENELVPTLLSAEINDLELAVQIFDESQLTLIIKEAEQTLATISASQPGSEQAADNLKTLKAHIRLLQQQVSQPQ